MTEKCELCHGTGQRCYFGGESRFVLTWQDCPACCGTGEAIDADVPPHAPVEQRSGEALPEDNRSPS